MPWRAFWVEAVLSLNSSKYCGPLPSKVVRRLTLPEFNAPMRPKILKVEPAWMVASVASFHWRSA